MPRRTDQTRLTEDFEWEQSTKTFTSSSDRVRYIMVIVVLSVFVALFAWDKTRARGWMTQRIERMNLALAGRLAAPDCVRDLPQILKHPPSPDEIKTCRYVGDIGLHTTRDLEAAIPKFIESDVAHGYYIHFPIIDVTFDVNNLGLVAGCGFVFLMIVLTLSLAREHENLYLCLWLVRTKFEEDGEATDSGRSRGNLFYHSLAMAQVFSNPPSLGRWKRGLIDKAPALIFFLPIVPLGLILRNDLTTQSTGEFLSDSGIVVWLYIGMQMVALVGVAALSWRCLSYSRAIDHKWSACFRRLNPRLAELPNTPLASWLGLARDPRPGEGAFDGRVREAGRCGERLSQLIQRKSMTRYTILMFGLREKTPADLARLRRHHAKFEPATRIEILLPHEEGAVRASRRLARRWNVSQLAAAVVDASGGESLNIHRLDWWPELVQVEVDHGVAPPG
jgi:hypothetical protein